MSMLYQKNICIVKQIANVGIIRINVKKLMPACYNLSLLSSDWDWDWAWAWAWDGVLGLGMGIRNWEWEMGNGKWEMGKWKMEMGKWEIESTPSPRR